ncbi:MAG TPA: hypothetical protein VHE54_03535 [Puia sp.]|nr:hypothetical protein [Puia sp.]
MLYNNLKLAVRHLRKNAIFSLLNVFGLTVGQTSCILIGNVASSVNRTPQTHVGFNANLTRKLDAKGSELSVDADWPAKRTPVLNRGGNNFCSIVCYVYGL